MIRKLWRVVTAWFAPMVAQAGAVGASGEVAVICGHPTRESGKIEALGVSTDMSMPRNDDGELDYCLDCIARMTITCAWCGEVIFIGTPVTLYGPSHPWVFPAGTVFHSDNPLSVVGCPSSECADTGADYVGVWRSMYIEAARNGSSVRNF